MKRVLGRISVRPRVGMGALCLGLGVLAACGEAGADTSGPGDGSGGAGSSGQGPTSGSGMTSSKATLEIVSLAEDAQGGLDVEVRLTNVSAGSLSLDPTAFAVRDPSGVDTKGDQYTVNYVANPCDAGKAVSNGGSATCKVHFDVPHDYIGKAFVYSESGVTLVVPYDVDLDPPVPPPPPGICGVVDDGCATDYPDGAESVAQLLVKYCGCPGDVCASACAGSAGCDDPTHAAADCCACIAEHSDDSCVYEAVLGPECNADASCSAFVQCELGG